MKEAFVVTVFVGLLAVIAFTEGWRWSECRLAGHGVMYCLNESGK